jgi:hypothetical protein
MDVISNREKSGVFPSLNFRSHPQTPISGSVLFDDGAGKMPTLRNEIKRGIR